MRQSVALGKWPTTSRLSAPSQGCCTATTSNQALEYLLKPVHMQVVSQAAAAGRVAVVQSLADIQGQDFPAPTVVIAGKVGGMEDIPVRPLIPDCPPCPYHVGIMPGMHAQGSSWFPQSCWV